jgi:hypothetical protein
MLKKRKKKQKNLAKIKDMMGHLKALQVTVNESDLTFDRITIETSKRSEALEDTREKDEEDLRRDYTAAEKAELEEINDCWLVRNKKPKPMP